MATPQTLPKLGYWNLRGLAQPIRLLLKYTGTNFEDARYEIGGPPKYGEQWFSVKETFGFDFPNMPYYIDPAAGIKLTQSNAILRYIARKHGLAGKDENEVSLVDVLENEIIDFRTALSKLVYNPAVETMKAEYLTGTAKPYLQKFSTFLGSKPWLIGDQITYPDFLFYEILDIHRLFEPTILDDYPNLKEYLSRFEALAPIQAYMQSSEFIHRPLYGPMAAWGYKVE